MNAVLAWAGARLLEPSTWAGIAVLASSIAPAVASHDWTSILQAAAGAIAVAAPEKHV